VKLLHSLPALLVCGLLTAPAASAAPWYRVEMMLVAYENQDNIDHELWADALPSRYHDDDQTQPDFGWWQAPAMYRQLHSALYAGFSFPQIPAAELPAPFTRLKHHILQSAEARINSRSDMQVVWHQAWIEPVQEEDKAVVHPVNIHYEDDLVIEISGSFTLHRSRYLHLNTDLVVQHYSLDENPVLNTLTLPDSHSVKDDYRTGMPQSDNGPAFAASPAELQPTPLRAAEVRQSRRMRSNELHYIDHPMLGIVIKLIPVEDASSLADDISATDSDA
tara:strand:- start:5979 stop:6809 length:831 start_codon:yes stop_codon:yes gene_type:complete